MTYLQVDFSNILNFVTVDEILSLKNDCQKHLKNLIQKTGVGNNLMGWIDLPNVSLDFLDSTCNYCNKISKKFEIIVLVGIGGSYLGAKAIINALNHHFSTFKKNTVPHILYAGQNISGDYLHDLLEILNHKEYAVVVISKSGTTLETAIAFRLLKNHLEKKYGKTGAQSRIIAITDKEKGILKNLSTIENYKTFIIPENVGGRYSVLSPAGLIPIALAGYNIRELLKGAEDMKSIIFNNHNSFDNNPALVYAACRNILYQKGYTNEILVNYEPRLIDCAEWWKQLFAESEGKNGKGIFPVIVNYTTDLHSIGQYVQDGVRNLFETIISIQNSKHKIDIFEDEQNLDRLNYLRSKQISTINKIAETATMIAHVNGGVPNLKIKIPEINEYYLGQFIYFFQIACAVSSYLFGVNPFDQPGVEDYKINMFSMLGKQELDKK